MAEVKEVTVPDIGDFTDVPVIEVLVSPGDTVSAEDPLVTLESDKATMDVPAPFDGTVKELKVEVGDTVSEGSVIATVETGGGDGAGGDDADASDDAADGGEGDDGAEDEAGEPDDADASAPQDTGAEEAPGEGRGDEAEGAPGSTAAVAEGDAEPDFEVHEATSENADAEPEVELDTPAYASPSVRRLARKLGVDLSTVKGTGRKGRITAEDVKTAKDKPAGTGSEEPPPKEGGAAVAGLDLASWPKVDFEKFGEVERVALTRIQRISGPNLARNWVMIPHVTHNDHADVTELEAFRKQVNSEQDVKVTMVALLLKACVASLKQFPVVNSSLDGTDLVLKRYYHLGFAADTPQGLMVPVIKDVDQKGLLQLAAELSELSAKARDGKLKITEMQGATFTISSLGGIGGDSFTPIINAPEVAILGVTRSRMQPVWNGSEFVPRLLVPLSLSYDHRVIDGALAARFTAHLAGVLSDLRRVLL